MMAEPPDSTAPFLRALPPVSARGGFSVGSVQNSIEGFSVSQSSVHDAAGFSIYIVAPAVPPLSSSRFW
jgi:hypothetical protein